ncbi:hypothetical protein M231_06023 [Tremella mesenterica]|uniref:Uncharacterized protein n=1 Tax=Tremella mesenterica TaxID=5217 RepID=A0A4Q1BGM3_TREME|nr:hypothetical protein M231_06023 [Tremella mesenterica]
MTVSDTLPFLSSTSANALISDLRPTTLSAPALQHINLLIDELITSLISAADSINPSHLRLHGIPVVFSGDKSAGDTTGLRALGRSAVGEAELELRSWYETNDPRKGLPPGGKGRGMIASKEGIAADFPVDPASQLMRYKCATFSTLAPQTPPPAGVEDSLMAAWKAAGGDTSEDTLAPAALWLTAILEHVCEHVLAQLARVVARDSSISTASVQDLYVALCEDESVWGIFKRMKVKDSLEAAIRAGSRPKRGGTPQRPSLSDSPTDVVFSSSNSPHGSKTSVGVYRAPSAEPGQRNPPTSFEQHRASPDHGRFGGLGRRPSSAKKSLSVHGHERSGSVLSVTTRSILGAYHEQLDPSMKHEEEEEFDALVRSGETMKVSLTPSRLKTVEMPGRGKTNSSPTQPAYVRPVRPTQNLSQTSLVDVPPMPQPRTDALAQSHGRGKSESGPRLTARGASTIEEEAHEDTDPLNGRKQQKHSLMEILSSAPADLPKQVNGSTKRIVPAVVLGTPPPKASAPTPTQAAPVPSTRRSPPSQLQPTFKRTTKRQDPLDDDEDLFPRPRRGKTEAQELADFLNNTAPPVTSQVNFDEPLPTSKSTRGFRSLMSKVTGGRRFDKSDKDKYNEKSYPPPLVVSTSHSNLGIAGGMKRNKSMQSMASANTMPSTNRGYEEAPPLPQKTTFRKGLPVDTLTGISGTKPDTSVTGVVLLRDIKSKDRISNDKLPSIPQQTIFSAVEGKSTTPPTQPVAALLDRRPSDLLQGKRLEDEHIRSTTPKSSPIERGPEKLAIRTSSLLAAQYKDGGSSPLPIHDKEIPSPIITVVEREITTPLPAVHFKESTSASDPDASALEPPSALSTGHDKYSSDANSFQTAEEGDSDSSPTALEPVTTDQSSQTAAPTAVTESEPTTVDTAPVTPPEPVAPSIPLEDLMPLRHLLDHATSARECRLLLSAILTQWGVPQTHPEGEWEQPTPEARVTAWLLAGRDGPLNIPLPPSSSSSRPEEDLQTPRAEISVLPLVGDSPSSERTKRIEESLDRLRRADENELSSAERFERKEEYVDDTEGEEELLTDDGATSTTSVGEDGEVHEVRVGYVQNAHRGGMTGFENVEKVHRGDLLV